jgi:putative oxidoreductase
MSTCQRAGWAIARLLLRSVIGAIMIAHGVKHSRRRAATAGWFGSLGLQRPYLQAQGSSAVEIGSGAAPFARATNPYAAAGTGYFLSTRMS